METSTLMSQNGIIDRAQLALVPTPQGTVTHRPIPHCEVVQALIETLGFRHIGVVQERYAVDKCVFRRSRSPIPIWWRSLFRMMPIAVGAKGR